jgi:hypothetical protein
MMPDALRFVPGAVIGRAQEMVQQWKRERKAQMPEHFTKAAVAATWLCKKCGKPTLHRVDDGRRGPCLACLDRLEAEAKKPRPPAPATQGMFW